MNMRHSNLGLIVAEVRRQPRTRAQLASDVDMTKAAVGSLVGELERRGVMHVSDEAVPSNGGRPGRAVKLVSDRVLSVGISLSGSYVIGAVVDLAGATVARHLVPVRVQTLLPQELCEVVVDLVHAAVKGPEFGPRHVLLGGVAVGAPDLVDSRVGVVRRSATIGLTDFPLRQTLEVALADLTDNIHVENDARLGAIAEHRHLGQDRLQNLVYLTGSTAIGAGVIADGHVLRGRAGYAGEVGHTVIAPDGRRCTCGNDGCLEAEVGVLAFLEAAAEGDDPVRDRQVPLDERMTTILSRAADGDPRILAAIQHVGTNLGLGVAGLINILNPDAVVLGGYFARLFPYLRDALNRVLIARVMPESLAGCEIVPSELGAYAGAIGAGHVIADQVIANPAAVPFRASVPARLDVQQLLGTSFVRIASSARSTARPPRPAGTPVGAAERTRGS